MALVTIAALEPHSIGVLVTFPFLLRRSSDYHLTCINFGLLGRTDDSSLQLTCYGGPIPRFLAFYTHCCGAAGPSIVTISREGLLDTHLVLGERCPALYC